MTHDEITGKSRGKDPKLDALVAQQVMDDATNQVQGHVRKMLNTMIEIVPGQLFRDIRRFHTKFELPPTDSHGHELPNDVLRFRTKFLLEELVEYMAAVGLCLSWNEDTGAYVGNTSCEFDAEKAFDALIDLAYVALGTAYLHRFPFNEGWERVQEANMAKVRATGADDPLSHRKHAKDVVKPKGWKPPVLADLLDEACGVCGGAGKTETFGSSGIYLGECRVCGGTGRRRKCPPTSAT